MSLPLPTRIYVGAPFTNKLDARQIALRKAIYKMITDRSFEIQHYRETGVIAASSWSLENLDMTLRRCRGAVILGFNIGRYKMLNSREYGTTSEYTHIEGAYACAQSLPTLIITELGNAQRGILTEAIAFIPMGADENWLSTVEFESVFNAWCKKVNERYHVFLGYSTGARETAKNVKTLL